MSVSGSNAYMTKGKSKKVLAFSPEEIVECVNFIIDNSFISFRGTLYRQVIGIPMGVNCGPHLANIFLNVYEKHYIDSLIQDGKESSARQLSSTCRYQDDCIVLNDGGLFNTIYAEIYPTEMILDNTNVSKNKSHYLDLTISIYRGQFVYKSYDKRNSYNFKVINYPDLKSNIPINPAYGVFTSQLIRFCKINNVVDNFKVDVTSLVSKLVEQNFDKKILKTKFLEFCVNHVNTWGKFGLDIVRFAEEF